MTPARQLRHKIPQRYLDGPQPCLDRAQSILCNVCGFGVPCVYPSLQRAILRFERHTVLHPRQQHIDLPQRERLCEIVIGPKTDGRYGGVEGGVSGDNYDLCRRARSARRLQNAHAVRTRKMQVGQDQSELPGASVDERDSGEAIARRGHAVAAGSEMLGEQLPDLRLVVETRISNPFAG